MLAAACVGASALSAITPAILLAGRKPIDGVEMVIGQVEKHAQNPLFIQDKPWEPRLDNGYPNVIYDEDDSDGQGKWRCWYGDCVSGCGSQILLYANSSDGLTWEKPELGLFDVKEVRKDLAQYGKNNNIIMKGGGLGIYKDPHETNSSRKFKCFGSGCAGADGTAVSADGLIWTDPKPLSWPQPQRYDCHNQVLYVPSEQKYIATTRDGFSGPVGRTVGITESASDDFDSWDLKTAPVMVEKGDANHQLYSQITFQWHGAFLGIVMVYDATDPVGRVHCRLSWSPSDDGLSGWEWVDAGGLTGKDFIPLGRNNLPPPAPTPAPLPCSWEPVMRVDKSGELSDCAAYRAGQRPEHEICADATAVPKQKILEATLASCKKICQEWDSCKTIQWQGEQKYDYSVDKPGQCYLLTSECTKQKSYVTKLAPTFCMNIEHCTRKQGLQEQEQVSATATIDLGTDFDPGRRGGATASPPQVNDFDSHICFAAASPVLTPAGEHRIYYMGGNGPHNGARNSSFALASLGKDRFAGLAGTGSFGTSNVSVTAPALTITADVAPGGSVKVAVKGAAGLGLDDAEAVSSNVTDAQVSFAGGKDLSALMGKEVELLVELKSATLFTVGFV